MVILSLCSTRWYSMALSSYKYPNTVEEIAFACSELYYKYQVDRCAK